LQRCGIVEPSIEQIESWALHSLRDALAKFSKTFEDFGLPTPSIAFDRLETNRLLEMERDYNVEVLQAEVVMAIESLNDGQRAAYNGVIDAYAAHHAKVIFIDGPGGTGKTYIEKVNGYYINGYWWLFVIILYIKATVVVFVCLYVCVGSAWKILPVTARSLWSFPRCN